MQIYIRDDVASLTRANKELKAFKRVTLASGEAKTVDFEIPAKDLGFWTPKGDYWHETFMAKN